MSWLIALVSCIDAPVGRPLARVILSSRFENCESRHLCLGRGRIGIPVSVICIGGCHCSSIDGKETALIVVGIVLASSLLVYVKFSPSASAFVFVLIFP